MRMMFGLITQKWSTLEQIYVSKGQKDLLSGLKWDIVCLCSSNMTIDIAHNMKIPISRKDCKIGIILVLGEIYSLIKTQKRL